MTPILSSTKMIQQLANPLFKQDLVKKHEFYQCIYPILDDLYIPDKSYHDPTFQLLMIIMVIKKMIP